MSLLQAHVSLASLTCAPSVGVNKTVGMKGGGGHWNVHVTVLHPLILHIRRAQLQAAVQFTSHQRECSIKVQPSHSTTAAQCHVNRGAHTLLARSELISPVLARPPPPNPPPQTHQKQKARAHACPSRPCSGAARKWHQVLHAVYFFPKSKSTTS